MTIPNDEVGSILLEMQDAGMDLSQPVVVEFFQLFEKKENAKALADYLSSQVDILDVKLHPDQTPEVWDVDCTVKMIPSYENIVAKEAQFEKLARQYDGYNDGWGVHFADDESA
ncbi:ribonuclease E inhibitor RraB [Thalassotalea litorea]|uniref:Ribonuclease E inhibitor RraB n=1 Tax=Thalassotalea litorea TaxID=2020715 RepID=A0A5R9IM80_9GAMM|nr:ribonuclease E inhibitor RraB [Thalassotalea litorea]TLU66645.1 ribonuclease E inhibitor RraB [Thalassotalea litorea]